MLCKNCGSQLEEGAKFCGTCGTSISSPSVSVDEKPKKNFVAPAIGIIAVLLIVGGVYLRFFSNNNHKIVKDLINDVIVSNGYRLEDVLYVKEGSTWFLRVIIDKDGIINVDDCSRVTNLINPILDEADPIEDSYILDVCSMEKGE